MAHTSAPAADAAYPFAAMQRSADRERVLVGIVASVWETALRLPVLPRRDGLAETSRPEPAISGTIRISGAWNGLVAMTAPVSLATECGAIMYARPSAALSPAEVRDAWGELVNMVGGHLKALVPPESRLALPAVSDADFRHDQGAGYALLNEMTFACLGSRLRVTVLKGS